MIETVEVETWITATLGADTALGEAAPGGVHSGQIPQGEERDAVIFSLQDPGDDENAASSDPMLLRLVYQIKAAVEGEDYGRAKPAADRIDALLRKARATTDNLVIRVQRQSAFALAETDDDTPYRHLGGLYEFLVSPIEDEEE